MEIVDNKALLLKTRTPDKFKIIPRSKHVGIDADGLHEIAVFWGMDEVRVLRNLGVKHAPSPILREYEWPGRYTPFKHQMETAAFLTLNRRAFVFSEPGTAKTISALWAADYLMKRGEVRRVLILCPLSIMHSAWMSDIANSVIHRSAVVAHHSIASRRIELIQNKYEIVVMNFDGLALTADAIIKDGTFDLVIIDEANAFKNVTTKRWKVLNRVLKPTTMVWMMTGTPAAQSPEDAYGLAKVVNPGGVPQYFTGWKDKVMNKVSMFRWIAKPDAYDKVHAALQPAIRYTKAECLDLPPVLVETREVALTPQQLKYYNILKTQMLFSAGGETITAINAAAEVNKLLQISAGAAYTDSHETVEFDCMPRLNVLEEVLNETNRKVIVFAAYRSSLDTIEAHLNKLGIGCAQINGGVSPTRRTEIFKQFQKPDFEKGVKVDAEMHDTIRDMRAKNPNYLRVLVIQPQAASHGVTLTAADTVVFWGPVMSVETYIQCCARADRQGQTSDKVTVVHIQGSDIEKRMFKQLANKVDDNGLLLKIYEEEVAARAGR